MRKIQAMLGNRISHESRREAKAKGNEGKIC